MSLSFRPVKEVWGPSSDCFVDTEDMLAIFELIADKSVPENFEGLYFDHNEYANHISVWILYGQKFLDFIAGNQFTASWLIDNLEYEEPNPDDVGALVNNLKAFTKQWQSSIDEAGGGCLRFYVDN